MFVTLGNRYPGIKNKVNNLFHEIFQHTNTNQRIKDEMLYNIIDTFYKPDEPNISLNDYIEILLDLDANIFIDVSNYDYNGSNLYYTKLGERLNSTLKLIFSKINVITPYTLRTSEILLKYLEKNNNNSNFDFNQHSSLIEFKEYLSDQLEHFHSLSLDKKTFNFDFIYDLMMIRIIFDKDNIDDSYYYNVTQNETLQYLMNKLRKRQ